MISDLKSALHRCLGVLHRAAFKVRLGLRARAWRPAVPRPVPKTPVCLVSGYFNETLGVGRAGQLVADGLQAAGLTVLREDLRPFDRKLLTGPVYTFSDGRGADVWLIEANPPEARIALFSHDYAVWKDLYRIGFWHWESSIAPTDWVALAPWFHEIWVSSTFVAEAMSAAFHKAGMADQITKLRVMPLPVHMPPPQASRPQDDIVQAITLFDPRSAFDRKNPMAVIRAWLTAFPEPVAARLTIKALDNARAYPAFAELIAAAKGRPDIAFVTETLTYPQTEALIGRHDILISLHRGEGFGLTLAEAMSMGLSVIATGWSGNMQFMTAENSVPIPYTLVPASPLYNGPEAQWAEPEIDAAADALRTLINNKDLRDQLGRQAISDIRNLHTAWTPDALFTPEPRPVT